MAEENIIPVNNEQPLIEIGEEDLRQSELLLSLKKEASDELTLDDGSIVRLGLPLLHESGVFLPPDVPHVFESDITLIREGGGKAVKEAIDRGILKVVGAKDLNKDPLGDYLDLGKCVVIFAHGINRGAGELWNFADGQNIPQVVNAYNRYADENKIPRADLIASCNADPREVDLRTNRVVAPESNQVRVGAFNEVAGTNMSTAYVVGELAMGSGRLDPNQGIIFLMETHRGSIFNLENLIAVKEVSPDIKLE